MATEPIQVPIVAMARIVKVHTRVGDRVAKGKLLIELDSRMEQVKHDAAASAVTTALSEKERIILGSSYIAANERPEREKIRNEIARKMYKNQDEIYEINRAVGAGMSRASLLMSEANLLTAALNLQDSEWALKVATAGLKESLIIAECKINEAKLALRYRQLELENFRVYSPCDGVVERCVVHDGEYNQDPGKPAILLDMGLWFEARMDQTTAGQVALGDTAMVYLTSSPNQPLPGRVTLLGPSVSYDAGGPEATRPIRPIGSGAPEWPSTYFIRIQLDSTTLPLIPGLTGFARIESQREVLAVPISALFARSGRSALVYLVDGKRYRPCQVVVGFTTEGWAEIRSGLPVGAEVLTEGHQILQPGDKITVTQHKSHVVPHAVLEDGESILLNK